MLFWQVLFWLVVVLLLHTYLFFPWLLQWLTGGRKVAATAYTADADQLPTVSVLLAAYNEERVIARKIESTFNTNYPLEKIEFLIGSDASSDATDSIIQQLQKRYPQLQLYRFPGRTGKAGIINALAEKAQHDILVLTDANVFFKEDTLFELVKYYYDPHVGLVGGNILNIRFKRDGISFQEKTYLSRENLIKYQEGLLWQTMIGAFGGCYSLRRHLYSPVPPRFFMDDFYITMHVLEEGAGSLMNLEAVCYEDVSNKISEEFRRKVRISIGNFQNLFRYKKLLWPPWSGLGFSFLSHKVLRWLGPFFILLALLASGMLAQEMFLYRLLFIGQLILLSIPLLDALLKKIHIHFPLLRFVSHFYLMNLALLTGFFKFAKGVESNIWKPTQRYQ